MSVQGNTQQIDFSLGIQNHWTTLDYKTTLDYIPWSPQRPVLYNIYLTICHPSTCQGHCNFNYNLRVRGMCDDIHRSALTLYIKAQNIHRCLRSTNNTLLFFITAYEVKTKDSKQENLLHPNVIYCVGTQKVTKLGRGGKEEQEIHSKELTITWGPRNAFLTSGLGALILVAGVALKLSSNTLPWAWSFTTPCRDTGCTQTSPEEGKDAFLTQQNTNPSTLPFWVMPTNRWPKNISANHWKAPVLSTTRASPEAPDPGYQATIPSTHEYFQAGWEMGSRTGAHCCWNTELWSRCTTSHSDFQSIKQINSKVIRCKQKTWVKN